MDELPLTPQKLRKVQQVAEIACLPEQLAVALLVSSCWSVQVNLLLLLLLLYLSLCCYYPLLAADRVRQRLFCSFPAAGAAAAGCFCAYTCACVCVYLCLRDAVAALS